VVTWKIRAKTLGLASADIQGMESLFITEMNIQLKGKLV